MTYIWENHLDLLYVIKIYIKMIISELKEIRYKKQEFPIGFRMEENHEKTRGHWVSKS